MQYEYKTHNTKDNNNTTQRHLEFCCFFDYSDFLYDRCRYYYELPDDMSFTIWKRFLKNECYIIPGEYKAFLPPMYMTETKQQRPLPA